MEDKDQTAGIEVVTTPQAPVVPKLATDLTNEVRGSLAEIGASATNVIAATEKRGDVLEEFEFEGKPAKVLRLCIGDISNEDLEAHARNLAAANFKLLTTIPDAENKANLRERLYIESGGKADKEELDAIYPDITREEHFRAYRDLSFPRLMKAGGLLAVEVDGHIVATLGRRLVGTTPSGREVFELEKGSVLNDPRYRDKKIHSRLTRACMKETSQTNPNAMWISASTNPVVLKAKEAQGWKIVEMDDPNEGVQLMAQRSGDYTQTMKAQGYKAMYFYPETEAARS